MMGSLARVYIGAGRLTDALGVLNRLQPLEEGNGKGDDATETALTIALLQASDEADTARAALLAAAPRIENVRDEAVKARLLGTVGAVQWRLGDQAAARTSFEAAATRFAGAGDEKSAATWRAMAQSLAAAGNDFAAQWNALQGRKPTGAKPQEGNNNQDAANGDADA